MKHPIKTLSLALLLAVQMPALAASKSDIESTLDKADAERKKAAELGHEWRFTGKWIKEARAALESGDLDKANTLAEKALFEATRAQEQAKTSKTTWEIAVPK